MSHEAPSDQTTEKSIRLGSISRRCSRSSALSSAVPSGRRCGWRSESMTLNSDATRLLFT